MDERRLKEQVLANDFDAAIFVEGKGGNPSLLYLVFTEAKADSARLKALVVEQANAALRAAAEHKFEGAAHEGEKPKHKGNVVFLVRNSRDDRRGFISGFSITQLQEIAAANPNDATKLIATHAWSLGEFPSGQ